MTIADENEIATNLRVVISRLVKILRSETRGNELLSLTERSTLVLVYESAEILPSELALLEKVTTQSMSQIINKLARLGYIKKTSSKTDKRKAIITVTARGKKFVESKRHEKQEWLAMAINEKTTQREKETLLNAIKVLTKLVDLK